MQELVCVDVVEASNESVHLANMKRYRYKNGRADGPVIGPWIGSTWHYQEALMNPRFEDYHIRYLGHNRFAYLGHGRTKGEMEGADMTAIITQPTN